MKKYVVVAGSRSYFNYEEAKDFISACLKELKDEIVIVSGGCKGADFLGEKFAEENNFSLVRYLPEWEKYGKAAGPIRNKTMVDHSHIVICFWDYKSRGTKSLIEYAKKLGKPLYIKRI